MYVLISALVLISSPWMRTFLQNTVAEWCVFLFHSFAFVPILLLSCLLLSLTIQNLPKISRKRNSFVSLLLCMVPAMVFSAPDFTEKCTTTNSYVEKDSKCLKKDVSNAYFQFPIGDGKCVSMGSARVKGIGTNSAIPGLYMPTSVENAYSKLNMKNKLSEWSAANQKDFKEKCTILAEEVSTRKNDLLCCNEEQFSNLKTSLNQVSAITCPGCKKNLQNMWCQYTCNPSNSQFVDVKEVRQFKGVNDKLYTVVNEADYFAGQDWMDLIFQYCDNSNTFNSLVCKNKKTGIDCLNVMGEFQYKLIGAPLKVNFKTSPQNTCPCGSNKSNCYKPMSSKLILEPKCASKPSANPKCMLPCSGKEEVCPWNAKDVKLYDWKPFWDYMNDGLDRAHLPDQFNVIVFGTGGGLVLLCLVVLFLLRKKSSHKAKEVDEDEIGHNIISLSFVDDKIAQFMQSYARFISIGNRPWYVIAAVFCWVVVSSLGLMYLDTESDPIKLWVAESSEAFQNRERFGKYFEPFYRSQQVFMVPRDNGPIGRTAYLKEAIRLQNEIFNLKASTTGIKLSDVCWKATGTACTVNSITQYFQNNMTRFEQYEKKGMDLAHFKYCLKNTASEDARNCPDGLKKCPCMSDFGAPMDMYNTYLGGFDEAKVDNDKAMYSESKAIVVSYLLLNNYDKAKNADAISWERTFINYMKIAEKSNSLFKLSYMSESSIEDEISRSSTNDTFPIILSFILMLIYVTGGLNNWSLLFNGENSFKQNFKAFWAQSKFLVGFVGVVMILLSIATTFGLFSWGGIKIQLIIFEVVPFLTLAIGVDNIFLLVHGMNDAQKSLGHFKRSMTVEEKVAAIMEQTLVSIGPSITMASFIESIAFTFGCISPMPVVLWFAAFAFVAILINYFFQMTLFVALALLDKRRELAAATLATDSGFESPHYSITESPIPTLDNTNTITTTAPFTDRLIDGYAAFLSYSVVKFFVFTGFILATCLSIYSCKRLDHGLPQQDSMPSDSYMIDYFNTMDHYLATGPPIYYVVEGGYKSNPTTFDVNSEKTMANLCQNQGFCNDASVPRVLDQLRKQPHVSKTSKNLFYSWLDSFWEFSDPSGTCCRVDKTGKNFIPINTEATKEEAIARNKQQSCIDSGVSVPPLPKESFMSIFHMFATSAASVGCANGGASMFRGQFSVDKKPIKYYSSPQEPRIKLNSPDAGKAVTAFSYMTISTACPNQTAFIDTYKQANRVAKYISENTGVHVWAYSIFFAFFDQYLTVVEDAFLLIGLPLAAIFLLHMLYFVAFWVPLLITIVIANTCLTVVGMMQPLGIMLNGLSIVNLIIAAGITVEVTSHYARAFEKSEGSGDERMRKALHKVILTVLFGITITNIVGLCALSMADSRIFEKYYFRMYIAIVLSGLLHGTVLMPVLLSVFTDLKNAICQKKEKPEVVYEA